MKLAHRYIATLLTVVILGWTTPLFAQPAPAPPAAPGTIWSFLGIPQGMNKLHGTLFNRRGNHPGLEKKPPLKALADPANLFSKVPAIKKAAEVKAAEDLAPQKIKAVKYLAKIGCGCYNVDGSITEAMVSAMGDCTEDVRLATIKAIADAAEDGRCEKCNQVSCCNEDISKKLAQIAYERDEHGCWLEPSERVREAAVEALEICCSGEPPIIEEKKEHLETVPHEAVPQGQSDGDEAPVPPKQASLRRAKSREMVSSRRVHRTNTQFAALARQTETSPSQTASGQRGMTIFVDAASQLAQVQFPNANERIAVGRRLRVYRRSGSGFQVIGQLEVVEASPGTAQVRPVGGLQLSQIGPGVVVAR